MNSDKKLKTKEKVSWKVTKADGSITEKTEEIVVEHFMEVSVNGIKAFTLSCTPEYLRELALVSKAVPTSKALELAKRYGLKLICKAWPDSFCITGF